jgi:hypothetical protein
MFAELVDGSWQNMARTGVPASVDPQLDAVARVSARHAPDSPEARSAAVTEPDAAGHEPASLPPASTRAIFGRRPGGIAEDADGDAAAVPGAARLWPPVTSAYAALRAAAPPQREVQISRGGGGGGGSGGGGGAHSGSAAAADHRQAAATSSRCAGGGLIPGAGAGHSARSDAGASFRPANADRPLQGADGRPAAAAAASGAAAADLRRDGGSGGNDAGWHAGRGVGPDAGRYVWMSRGGGRWGEKGCGGARAGSGRLYWTGTGPRPASPAQPGLYVGRGSCRSVGEAGLPDASEARPSPCALEGRAGGPCRWVAGVAGTRQTGTATGSCPPLPGALGPRVLQD